jgi:hypothetical protein
MNKEDREKLEDVAGFLQGWLAFKKPVPTEEVIKLHFDLVMEVLAKNNEALDPVSYCDCKEKTEISITEEGNVFCIKCYRRKL